MLRQTRRPLARQLLHPANPIITPKVPLRRQIIRLQIIRLQIIRLQIIRLQISPVHRAQDEIQHVREPQRRHAVVPVAQVRAVAAAKAPRDIVRGLVKRQERVRAGRAPGLEELDGGDPRFQPSWPPLLGASSERRGMAEPKTASMGAQSQCGRTAPVARRQSLQWSMAMKGSGPRRLRSGRLRGGARVDRRGLGSRLCICGRVSSSEALAGGGIVARSPDCAAIAAAVDGQSMIRQRHGGWLV